MRPLWAAICRTICRPAGILPVWPPPAGLGLDQLTLAGVRITSPRQEVTPPLRGQVIVQQPSGLPLAHPLPGDLAASERIALRVARLLIDGHCVISPFVHTVHCTLDGQDSPALRTVREDEPQPVHGVCERFALNVAGRHLELGPVVFFHSRALAEDRIRLAAALDAGQATGMRLVLRPADSEHFRLLLQSTAPGTAPSPVPLGLAGFPEPR